MQLPLSYKVLSYVCRWYPLKTGQLHIPYSIEHRHFMKLTNHGTDEKTMMSLTMQKFPLLKKDGPIKPHCNIDHALVLKSSLNSSLREQQMAHGYKLYLQDKENIFYFIKTWPHASLLYYMASQLMATIWWESLLLARNVQLQQEVKLYIICSSLNHVSINITCQIHQIVCNYSCVAISTSQQLYNIVTSWLLYCGI